MNSRTESAFLAAKVRVTLNAGPLDQDANRAMDRVADGNEDSFAVVRHALEPLLFAHARRHCASHADAEDVVQHTFIRIIKHSRRGLWIPGAPVRPWAFSILANLLKDARRSAIRGGRVFVDVGEDPSFDAASAGPGAEQVVSEHQDLDALFESPKSLPEDQRRAVELHYLDGLSHADVAAVCGKTEAAVKALLWRARESLKCSSNGRKG